MAIGVSSVLNMGVGALFASQASIQTVGNNISNVNTEGYSRQAVVLQERYGINFGPGQVGQGVQAKEIIRYFDAFIEKNYLSKLSNASRYQSEYSELRYVDNLFNESNADGIYTAISDMFKGWSELAKEANSLPAREALLSQAKTLTQSLNNADAALRELENQINAMIRQDVDSANQLLGEIAALNKEINANYLEGRNNPNALMDVRDSKVRELATIMDVDVHDRGPGHYSVTMKNGTTLVQNDIPFELRFSAPGVESNLTADSPYKNIDGRGAVGQVHFSGNDSHEYTLEMVSGHAGTDENGNPVVAGTEVGGVPPAKFKVSLDGGRSWLSDENGNVQYFNAQEQENSVLVGDMEIWFDAGSLAQGDRFVISPKTDIYWVSPTSDPINISTQIYGDGTDNPSRITGGSLAGLIEFRDYDVGEYRDRLDALSKNIIWEVNRVHSQGVGLESLTTMSGTYVTGNVNQPLGSPEARFTWSDSLQSGNMTFSMFDADGEPVQPYPSLDVFDSLGNFDPAKHSLKDVKEAIDATNYLKADIVDGKLQVSVDQSAYPGYSFAITADTTGVAAALGLNTFFTGDNAETIALNEALGPNLNLINSGRLDVLGQFNPGDNQTANELASLASKAVEIGTIWNQKTSQSLAEYYGSLVTRIGADTSSVKYTAASETAIAQDLYERQEEISGVNLDEEMSNLIKFQASYKAAAKLITTADEMLQTLLSLKQ